MNLNLNIFEIVRMNLSELKSKFFDYIDLNYVKSRDDPDEEPYRTKYVARKLLEALSAQIATPTSSTADNEFMKPATNEQNELTRQFYAYLAKMNTSREFLIAGLFDYYLSRNFIETEEVESGERILTRLVRQLDSFDTSPAGFEYNPLTIGLKLSALNELVYVWSSRGDYKRCLTLFESVEEACRAFQTGK